jgi:PAS domain S-box-containing protein
MTFAADENLKQGAEVITDWPLPPGVLLEFAPSGWVLLNREGTILLVNSEVERLFGYTRDELRGATVELLVPERLREVHVKHRDAFYANPTRRPMGLGMSLQARRKDGSEFLVEISLSPVEVKEGFFLLAAIRDVTERKRLEDERNRLAVELETEQERDRIGMDLHDGIMQELYAVGLTLELALEDIATSEEDAASGVERAIDQVHDVIRNIRSYIFDLRPRQFSGTLSSALLDLAREFQQNTQIDTESFVSDDLPEVAMDAAIAIYHITHEALSNIQKHAHAGQVSLGAVLIDDKLVVEVTDNGRGFDPSASRSQAHRGLRNISNRARSNGLFVDVHSTPGKGTRIRLELPLT